MTFRKWMLWVVVLVLLVGCFPGMALATNYKAWDVSEGTVDLKGVILKSGDKLTGGSGISVEIHYVDANGEEIEVGNGTVKTITVNGKKCKEWALTGSWGSKFQVGNFVQAALAFQLTPAYAVADAEGYYSINSDTYSKYAQPATDDNTEAEASAIESPVKVKFTGVVVSEDKGTVYVSIGDDMIIALAKAEGASWTALSNTRVQGKGEVMGPVSYQDSTVPAISCAELTELKYEPLHSGDNKKEVLEMKTRMQELGYFKAGASLSESYNGTCVERVKMFQQQNGLPATGEADSETLALLYSDAAKPNAK